MHHMWGERPCIKLAAELLFLTETRSGPATHDNRLPGAQGEYLLLNRDLKTQSHAAQNGHLA